MTDPLEVAIALRAEIAAAEHDLAARKHELTVALQAARDNGCTLAQIATALGVSTARASQLVRGARQ